MSSFSESYVRFGVAKIQSLTESDLDDIMNCKEPVAQVHHATVATATATLEKYNDVWVEYGTDKNRCLHLDCLEAWMQTSANPHITYGPAWWKVQQWPKRVKVDA